MKATFDLPDDLFKELKLRAVHEGSKLKDVVADVLRTGLGRGATLQVTPESRRKTGAMIKISPVTGLPVIHSPPGAPVRNMTAEQVQELIDQSQLEEDLERAGLPVR